LKVHIIEKLSISKYPNKPIHNKGRTTQPTKIIVKKMIARRLRNNPTTINTVRNIAPTIRMTTPPTNAAIPSSIVEDSTSLTGKLKIGEKRVLIKRVTENRLRKNRTNSLVSLKIFRRAYV
jgi:hypothetical protein